MKKLIVLVLMAEAFLVLGLMVGCGFVLTGSGNLKTKEYAFSDFNRVEVSSAYF